MDGQLEMDSAAAQARAEAGMTEAVTADRVQVWRQAADAWLDEQPAGIELTADDLVDAVGLPDEGVYRNNAVGGWFGAKSKARQIVFTGRFRKSGRIIGHGNLQRVWRVV